MLVILVLVLVVRADTGSIDVEDNITPNGGQFAGNVRWYCCLEDSDDGVGSSGSNRDKNSTLLSDSAAFYKNYAKLCFNAEHLKTGLNR